jgi:hypothetical protein
MSQEKPSPLEQSIQAGAEQNQADATATRAQENL